MTLLGGDDPTPILIDPASASDLAVWVAGYLAGCLMRADLRPATIEPHHANGDAVPSFTATIGTTQLVIHVDQVIA